jgi:AcrR family transcriptional regulator
MKSTNAPRAYAQVARAESAAATGTRIVEAFLGRLMSQWYDEITLDAVAKEAGVTVQTLVRRFGGKEKLLATSIQTLAARINTEREAPGGDLTVILEKLLADYEQTGDMVIRLLALEDRYASMKDLVNFGRGEHRKWVSTAFAGQLAALDPATRPAALDALIILTDVYTWKILRRDMAHSLPETAATLQLLIRSTLAGFSETSSR